MSYTLVELQNSELILPDIYMSYVYVLVNHSPVSRSKDQNAEVTNGVRRNGMLKGNSVEQNNTQKLIVHVH